MKTETRKIAEYAKDKVREIDHQIHKYRGLQDRIERIEENLKRDNLKEVLSLLLDHLGLEFCPVSETKPCITEKKDD